MRCGIQHIPVVPSARLVVSPCLCGVQGAAMAAGGGPHPVVLFSHGLGGCRNTYSVFCAELASQVGS